MKKVPSPSRIRAAEQERRLWIALGISLGIHALLLTLHFQFPEASRAMQEKAMDIILVNAKSARKPHDAQALAQANLDGGGNTDENRRARTPLPPTQKQAEGNDVQQMQRRVQELETAQQKLLTQAKSLRNVASAKTVSEQPSPVPTVSGLDLAESARAMARLEGEIAKTADEYSKKPRKKFVGARTEEYALAAYLDAWKQKIERIGTLNYPEAARRQGIYGSLKLTVSIYANGKIEKIEVDRSSGSKILDTAAIRIVELAAPYAAFPEDMRAKTDILSITRKWTFTRSDQLVGTE